MAGEVLDFLDSPGTIDFPLIFFDLLCFSKGPARGPERLEPRDFHEISMKIPREFLEGTSKVHETTSK